MGEEDGSVVDLDAQRKGKCAVIKTSTRQVSSTYYIHILNWLVLITIVNINNFIS